MSFHGLHALESSPTLPPTSAPARPRNFSSGLNTAMPHSATTLPMTRRNGDAIRSPFAIGALAMRAGAVAESSPEDYCTEYRKFTEWVPSYGQPLYLIAAGPNGNDVNWTRRFFKKWADYALQFRDGAPLLLTTGHALKFSQDQWYEMLFKANQMETLVRISGRPWANSTSNTPSS